MLNVFRLRPARVLVCAVAGVVALSALVARPRAASSSIVISEFRVRGPVGGSDEFVELFNLSAAPVNIGGWTIRASNASGTVGTRLTIAAGTVLSPGCYFLATNSSTSGGPYSGGVAGNQTYGTGITDDGGIAIADAGGTIIDQVGLSSGSAYGEGTRLASLGSSNQNRSYERLPGGVAGAFTDGDNNATDFVLVSPSTPQNLTSACVSTNNPTGAGTATPNPVDQGASTLLTVTVTAGTPAAAITSVITDLTAIGGANIQPLNDAGLNGDVTAGDGVFSFLAPVSAATPIGTVNLPVAIADAAFRSGSTTITLTVQAPPPPPAPFVAIHDIQGPASVSPYVGQRVRTRGVVTARRFNNGFFLQTPDDEADASTATSQGIFVFTSGAPPASATVGTLLDVEGDVAEFRPASDPDSPTFTELANITFTVVAPSVTLPSPMTLTAADMTPTGGIEQLERFEHMRVRVASAVVTAPTTGSISEANATATSNGVFFVTVPPNARPFREPGIQTPTAPPSGAPAGVPVFDANPENLRVDSDGQIGPSGPTRIDVAVGQGLSELVGVLDYSFRAYTVLPDPTALPTVTGTPVLTAVRAPLTHEFTVASANLQRFFDTTNDPGVGDVVLTATAFEVRLDKASRQIREIMQSPDIVGVVEVENLSVLEALAARLNSDTVGAGQPDPGYLAFLEEGNDPGGIDVGFLVKGSRVSVTSVVQEGKDATYIDPNTSNPALLNDRPPLVLRATVGGPGLVPSPITVIINHLRSLNGVDDPLDGARVRAKRLAQAEYLAALVQARQAADPTERIILAGDFNAFAFNDGYADVLGTILGTPAPATEVVLSSVDLVTPDLVRLADLAPLDQRYSYSFEGNAQELDHILSTANLLPWVTDVAWGRNNADFPETMRNLAGTAARVSDHDPMVVFIRQQQDTTTTLSSSTSTAFNGQSLTLTALVQAGTSAVSTGTVTFREGASVLGVVEVQTDGSAIITVTPSLGAHTYTATFDGTTDFAASTATTSVSVVTIAPTANDDSLTVLEGRSATVAVLANDSDDDNGTLTVTAVSTPARGTVTINGDQTLQYTSTSGVFGLDSFTYTVEDGQGGTATATVVVAISRLGRFVALGTEALWLRDRATVITGDVGANQAQRHSRGPRWHDDDMSRDHRVEVVVGEGVQMEEAGSRVVGDTVWLRHRTTVQDVFANELLRRGPFGWFGLPVWGATIVGTVTQPVDLPFVTMPEMPVVDAGITTVTVGRQQTRTLAPGRYGKVVVKARGTLVLSGGLYQVRSIEVEEGGTIRYDAAVDLRVARSLETDKQARIVAKTGSDLSAADLRISVAAPDEDDRRSGHRHDDDDPGPTVVRIGERNVVEANILATGGTVWIRDNTTATGAFLAERVRIGRHVTLQLMSAFR